MVKIKEEEVRDIHTQVLEACDIYRHMHRGRQIKKEYNGQLQYSLETIKLLDENLKYKKLPKSNRVITDDIVTIKFTYPVQSLQEDITKINASIYTNEVALTKLKDELDTVKDKKQRISKQKSIESKIKYIDKLIAQKNEMIEMLKTDPDNEHFKAMTKEELREYFYTNIINIDNKKMLLYKRSPSKSRKGEVLFIKANMRNKMRKWSRMGLTFKEDDNIALADILSYESLVLSALSQDELININPDNILVISDKINKFEENVRLVYKDNKDDLLKVQEIKDYMIQNDIFDGQSLLDPKYFPTKKGSMILRNHWFKTCAFACNIGLFFKDYCRRHGYDYNTYTIKDYFNNDVKVKDIKMITTPNSAKFLKLKSKFENEAALFDYWKEVIGKDGNNFGVCKTDKPSKFGVTSDNKSIHRTSYQFLNTFQLSDDELKDIAKFELDYIDKLKNDDETFINYLKNEANYMNHNDMWVNLYSINKDIVSTYVFRQMRASKIKKYKQKIRKGKLNLPNGDYFSIVANPITMLYHAVGEEIEPELEGNQIYTPFFDDGDSLIGFRSPHTSPSNRLVAINTHVPKIKKYMALSNNVVVVNVRGFSLPQKLSGSDQDGDQMALFKNDTLVNATLRDGDKYKVSINGVPSDKAKYLITDKDMARLDHQLGKSQLYIGTVVNEAQKYLSLYFDMLNKHKEDNQELIELVEVFTILSEIAIDTSKRMYQVDVLKQLRNASKTIKGYSYLPLFFQEIRNDSKLKYGFYHTSMDQLIQLLDKEAKSKAEAKVNVNISDLIKEFDGEPDRKQRQRIVEIIREKVEKEKEIFATAGDKKETMLRIDKNNVYAKMKLAKLDIKPSTLASTIRYVSKRHKSLLSSLINISNEVCQEELLNLFKNMHD